MTGGCQQAGGGSVADQEAPSRAGLGLDSESRLLQARALTSSRASTSRDLLAELPVRP